MKYLRKRLVHGVFLMLGVSVLCFFLTELAPGNFFDDIRLNPQISQETLAGLKARYGFNQPLPVRYALWCESVVKGEWGYSFAYNSPVRSLLMLRARNTLLLAGIAVTLAWMIAIPLGIWVANRPGSWLDRLVMAGTSLFISIPELVVVLLFLNFAVRTHALPVGGMTSSRLDLPGFGARLADVALHLVVPVTTLVLASLPILLRHVRTSMLETLKTPFMQAARGHGIGRVRLLFRYALPAAANPLVSLFGLSVGGLLSASLVVEIVMGWPGLGPLLLEATTSKDLYVVVGAVMMSTVFMIFGNFIADVLLVIVDPRVRVE